MKRESCVLVVVDMQEKLLPYIYNREQVTENVVKLMRLSEILSIPVILTEQYPKGLGSTVGEISSVFQELNTEKHKVEKMTFSCVGEPAFTDVLHSYGKEGKRTIILCGIEAHICVYQTAVDLLHMEYEVFFTTDATGSRAKANHKWIMRYLISRGVRVVPTETVIFQLLERAGTEEFKKMLPYLK